MFDLEKRIFYLSGEVDSETIGELCFNLQRLIEQDDIDESMFANYERSRIKLYIQSAGGSVYDAWALIDLMLQSPTPIDTYCCDMPIQLLLLSI